MFWSVRAMAPLAVIFYLIVKLVFLVVSFFSVAFWEDNDTRRENIPWKTARQSAQVDWSYEEATVHTLYQ